MKNQRTTSKSRKTKNNQNKLSGRIKSLFSNSKFTSAFVIAVLALGLYTVAVKNIPGLNPFQALASQPSIMTVNSQGLYLNRYYGGTQAGVTPVIAYSHVDGNDNFNLQNIAYECGKGKVVYNQYTGVGCPFSGLYNYFNQHFAGKELIEIREVDTGSRIPLCVGTDERALAELAPCPDVYGNNGGFGTIYIASQWTGPTMNSPATFLVNRHWTSLTQKVSFLCAYAPNSSIIANQTDGNGRYCAWLRVYSHTPPI
jgi:hypothetical protein